MEVRDAVEADAPVLADLTGQPVDVMRNLIHDRTVRVAIEPDTGGDESASVAGDEPKPIDRELTDRESMNRNAEPTDGRSIRGVVSYDARADVVHVIQLAGDPDVVRTLLEEPLGFAQREGMSVEALVEADAEDRREAIERAGFDRSGEGPLFDGSRTVRYRAFPEKSGGE